MFRFSLRFSLVAALMLWALPAAAQQQTQMPAPQQPPMAATQAPNTGIPGQPNTMPGPVTGPVETPIEACATLPFGSALFSDGARMPTRTAMSPKQRVTPGDNINIALWGAIEFEGSLPVDSQGMIYVRNVGPIAVAGHTEDTLAPHIQTEIAKVYRDVQVYARLEQSPGTAVMVTGHVGSPGQYYGSPDDNAVVWLRRAGGILPEQGSYRRLRILRDNESIAEIDLYDFLINGLIDKFVWHPQDVLVVPPPLPQVTVSGDVRNCAVFELEQDETNGNSLIELTQPLGNATHAIVQGHRNNIPFSRVYSVNALRQAQLHDKDQVRFYGSPQSEKIAIHVEGPTLGNRVLIVPVHTRLTEVLKHIPIDPSISNTNAISIKRKSVADAQMQSLSQSLNRLLQSTLTAPASSDGEASIRAHEAQMVERFVEQARRITPDGRIVLFENGKLNDLSLEEGDVIVIPEKTNVVSIEGEVVLPRTVVASKGADIENYISMAGGFTERALKNDFIVIHQNGSITRASDPAIGPGDRVLVLPRVDSKAMQTTKDIVQILYQIAVGAGVLINIDK